jgi:TonB family protein
MRKQVDRFVPCYEAALSQSPGLRGKMLIRFEVDRSGKVSKAEDAGSALHEPTLLSCVLSEVQKVSFPPPKGTATVTAPLVFRPPSSR